MTDHAGVSSRTSARVLSSLGLVLRLGLGALLIVAGVLKLTDPAQFALEIANYQLLPAVAPVVAPLLPAIEIVIGAALIVLPQSWRRSAALVALAMMIAFLFAVGSAYFRNVNIECGCFGGEGSPINHWTLVRNVCLLALTFVLLLVDRQRTPA